MNQKIKNTVGLLSLSVLFFTCKKDNPTTEAQTVASFITDKTVYYGGETITLTSTSKNAGTVKWTLPDGSTKNEKTVSFVTHTTNVSYTLPFTLYVTSPNGTKTDYITKNITVQPTADSTKVDSLLTKVYVINEGQFNTNNASISLYNPTTGDLTEDYYKIQNSSGVGDIAQSMNYINGKFYIVVNNSGKVIVCDNQLKKTSEISGLISPRYILPISSNKAYVSDLYSNSISVVDLNSNTKTSDIALGSSSERMVMVNNKVFVTTFNYPSTSYVYIIDATSNTKADSVNVGTNATNIVLDKNNKIWVLGNKLSRINPQTNVVELSLQVSNDSYFSSKLCLNKTKDTLYYLNTNIYKMAIGDAALPTSAFVSAGTKNFYGLGVNPNDYTIYATDALDYIQKANVYIYKANGQELKNFKAGISSNGFYFE